LKLANGGRDSRGRRIPVTNEPKASGERPERPDHLSPSAAEAWDSVCAALDGLGMLSITGAAAITLLAEMLGLKRDAYETLKKEGTSIILPNGCTAAHPQVSIFNKAAAQAKSLLLEFGLTPAGRPRVKINDTDPMAFDDLDCPKDA
jgi:P27 family predicted phage terminase small subunit